MDVGQYVMTFVVRRASVRWPVRSKGRARLVTAESGSRQVARLLPAGSLRDQAETKPAELIAAAHADSFSRALAQELGRTALSGGSIFTSAAITLERLAVGWIITNLHLNVVAKLPKVNQGKFIEASVRAKTNCLVSRVLRATISMNAKLEN